MNNLTSHIIIFTLLFLASCASRTPQEDREYNNEQAVRVMADRLK